MRFWRVPLDAHEIKTPRGDVQLIVDRCKGCAFCVEFCPRDVLAMSDAFNAKGYHYPEVAHPERCVDCDLCEVICPDFAIYCTPAPTEEAAGPDLRLVTKEDAAPPGEADKTGEDPPASDSREVRDGTR